MGKVYILNKGYHNYDEADRYGERVFVTDGPVAVFKVDSLIHTLKDALKSFEPDEDYLLISGPVILGILAVAILMKVHDKINLLLFDAKRQNYSVRILKYDML